MDPQGHHGSGDDVSLPDSTTIYEPPAREPVTLEEAKNFLRVTHSKDDELVKSLVSALRRYIEQRYQVALVEQVVQHTYSSGPARALAVMRAPFKEVTHLSATRRGMPDATMGQDTLYHQSGTPGVVCSRSGIMLRGGTEVTLRYRAGHAPVPASDSQPLQGVPPRYTQAIRMGLGYFYEHRSSVAVGTSVTKLPKGAEALLEQDHPVYV